jgi:hypothetical protein
MKNGNITDKELNSEKYMYESRTNKTNSTNATEGTNQTKVANETKSVKAEEVKAKEYEKSKNSTLIKSKAVDNTPKSMISNAKTAIGVAAVHNDYGIPLGNPFDSHFSFNNSQRCSA